MKPLTLSKMPNTLKSREEVEKEFDEKFSKPSDRKWIEHLTNPNIYLDNTDIKSHIHSLRQNDLTVIREWVERQKMEIHDLKSYKTCTFYSDHNPVWDGNYYTCEFCGQEFVKPKEIINRFLSFLTTNSKDL